MSTAVEFVLRMKDMMSGSMQRVQAAAHASFAKVDATISRTQRHLDNLGKTTKIKVDTSDLDRAEQKLRGKGSGGGLIGMMGGFSGIATATTAAAAAGFVSNGISGMMRQEQQLTGLKTFLGAQGAASAFANIKKDAEATPYSVDSLIEVNRALISAGVSAASARQDTMNLANAIAAVGGGNDELSRMAANMQQIKTIGKATAMDLRQFGMIGINVQKLLADATGKSVAEVEKMEVSYELLSYALSKAAKEGGMYAGALEAQSKTLAGRWGTLKDNVVEKSIQMANSIAPIISKVMELSNAFVEATSTASEMKATFRGVVGVLDTTLGAITSFFKGTDAKTAFAEGGYAHGKAYIEGLTAAGRDFNWFDYLRKVMGTHKHFQDYKGAALDAYAAKKIAEMSDVENAKIAPAQSAFNSSPFGKIWSKWADPNKYFSGGVPPVLAGGNGNSNSPLSRISAGTRINEGGMRSITINLGKLFDDINITTQTINEGVDRLEDRITEALLRVLNSGNAIQGN